LIIGIVTILLVKLTRQIA